MPSKISGIKLLEKLIGHSAFTKLKGYTAGFNSEECYLYVKSPEGVVFWYLSIPPHAAVGLMEGGIAPTPKQQQAIFTSLMTCTKVAMSKSAMPQLTQYVTYGGEVEVEVDPVPVSDASDYLNPVNPDLTADDPGEPAIEASAPVVSDKIGNMTAPVALDKANELYQMVFGSETSSRYFLIGKFVKEGFPAVRVAARWKNNNSLSVRVSSGVSPDLKTSLQMSGIQAKTSYSSGHFSPINNDTMAQKVLAGMVGLFAMHGYKQALGMPVAAVIKGKGA